MDKLEQNIAALMLTKSEIENRADALVAMYLSPNYGFICERGELNCWHLGGGAFELLTNPQQYVVQNRYNAGVMSMLRLYKHIKHRAQRLERQYEVPAYSSYAYNELGNLRNQSGIWYKTILFRIAPLDYSGPFLLGALEAAMLLDRYANKQLYGSKPLAEQAKDRLKLILAEIEKRAIGVQNG